MEIRFVENSNQFGELLNAPDGTGFPDYVRNVLNSYIHDLH